MVMHICGCVCAARCALLYDGVVGGGHPKGPSTNAWDLPVCFIYLVYNFMIPATGISYYVNVWKRSSDASRGLLFYICLLSGSWYGII